MPHLQALRDAVGALERRLREGRADSDALLENTHPSYRTSARNFIEYVLIRQTDLRPIQLGLVRHGLSSLGRLEGHVLDTLTKVRERLDDAIARGNPSAALAPPAAASPTWEESTKLLNEHAIALLGPRPSHRHTYVMVTAPDAAEVDVAWVERLLAAGMNVLRVNTAHEDERAWEHVVTTARRVAAARGAHLQISVDLPGPKVRTEMLQDGPRVVKWKPVRDAFGHVVTPCAIALRAGPEARVEDHTLVVPEPQWSGLAPGDAIVFRDARGKHRELTIVQRDEAGGTAELRATAYVVPGTTMTLRRARETLGILHVASVPARRFRVALAAGDTLCLVKHGATPPIGMPAIGCTLDAAIGSLARNQRVLFDDGHLETIVEHVAEDHAIVRVTYARGGAFALAAEKGLNLPDTELDLPLFSPDDEVALGFAARHADLVAASFVRGPDDVHELHRRLAALHADRVGVVLKIETRAAFARLPAIILAALERARVGVMIARGDLAIETSYERLAELQEEMLWLCEAAHVPVIWATQVLDTLARTGRPSRAEVTDAAMGVRAECVMLNKGPFVAEAVVFLDDILRRMEQHQYKKHSLYRRLHVTLPRSTSPRAQDGDLLA